MSNLLQNLSNVNSQQYTILIIDDNPTNLGVVSDYLEDYGFGILVARTGENGLKRAQYVKPDIILLDVMMPGIDGFETCQRLKSNETTKDIPVIFMTALSAPEDKVRGFKVGAVDYVTKPLQHEEVLARITTHLRIRDLTQSLQEQNTQLQKATRDLKKRAIQLEANSQVGQQVTSILDMDILLVEVAELIQSKFGYYFVGVWLLSSDERSIVLKAGAGHKQYKLPAEGVRIAMNTPNSIIKSVCKTTEAYLADNVQDDPNYLAIPGLDDTRSELALPLQIGGIVIGVLDIHSAQLAGFDLDDRSVLQTLANQIAIAIRNAQLYEAERQLRQMESERAYDLAELNQIKDKFFSIVSHDLRTPFIGLLGNTQLMMMGLEDFTQEELEDMVQDMHQSAKAAYNLLDNLLTWSRMEGGRMEYHPTDVKLNELAQNTVDLLKETANNKTVHLSHTISPSTIIHADQFMVDTIIRNLTSNALKFTPSEGQVTITTESYEADNQHIIISINDTGIGITAEDIEKIFSLDQLHTTPGTDQEQGTGLGLLICKEMVENHGGKIWIESEIGKGTAVKFTMPLKEA